jgi:hypothetical protein
MPRMDSPADLYTQIKLGLVRVNQKSRPEYRFWKDVDKNGPIHPVHGQCWVWTGYMRPSGYGRFSVCNKLTPVHRYSYEEFVGHVPHDLWVLHKCDNPACVRPDHLFLGTDQDNATDKVNKGRQSKGEVARQSELTEEDVRDIRRRYRRWSHNCSNARELAEEKGVARDAIHSIIAGKSWRHVL